MIVPIKYATLSPREFHGINLDRLDCYVRLKCLERIDRYHG